MQIVAALFTNHPRFASDNEAVLDLIREMEMLALARSAGLSEQNCRRFEVAASDALSALIDPEPESRAA